MIFILLFFLFFSRDFLTCRAVAKRVECTKRDVLRCHKLDRSMNLWTHGSEVALRTPGIRVAQTVLKR